MTRTEIKKILRLKRNDKIKLVQTLWDSIEEEQGNLPMPKEHIVLLENRLKKLTQGKSTLKSWGEIKRKFNNH